ncbi:DUF885 family protein [Wenzhouxiangella marina]|uniref:Uncharacterized protein n=1 Tax=Wenzhouxiangella marina TaxID=1579979 RepID=A0A0K0XXT4_9GAMM|nr:DUF885 family protein [Wenzhouxiangella marina]AKS42421.1 hypothetical protein WM2015_2056 [Wenzhouxiangella marina]MBB6085805.1 hypothetical protein [Wenzhouxiangella marina]
MLAAFSRFSVLVLSCLLALSGCQHAEPPVQPDPRLIERFDALRSTYWLDYWASHPIEATASGYLIYADRLPARRRADLEREIEQVRHELAALERFRGDALTDPARQNEWHRLIRHARERLLLLERVGQWQRDPRLYLAASAFEQLTEETLAARERRAQWMLARLQQLPYLLAAGQDNLNRAPQRFTLSAMRQASALSERLATLVESLIPAAPELSDGLQSALLAAQTALLEYRRHLETVVLPESLASAAIGPARYEDFLQEVHGLDLSLDQWLEQLDEQWEAAADAGSLLAEDRNHLALTRLDALLHSQRMSADQARHFLIDQLGMAHAETAAVVDALLTHPARVLAGDAPWPSPQTRLAAEPPIQAPPS